MKAVCFHESEHNLRVCNGASDTLVYADDRHHSSLFVLEQWKRREKEREQQSRREGVQERQTVRGQTERECECDREIDGT